MKDSTEKTPQAKDAAKPSQQPLGKQPDMSQSPQTASLARPSGQRRQQPQQGMARREWSTTPYWLESPIGMIQRFSEELDRVFSDFGMGRNLFGSRSGRERGLDPRMWAPQVETYERDNQF